MLLHACRLETTWTLRSSEGRFSGMAGSNCRAVGTLEACRQQNSPQTRRTQPCHRQLRSGLTCLVSAAVPQPNM